jgi:hypothetical protein
MQVHTKRRNRLLHDRMRDLVFVKFNSKLRQKKDKKDRDPLEKHVLDALEDEDNEWITGVYIYMCRIALPYIYMCVCLSFIRVLSALYVF